MTKNVYDKAKWHIENGIDNNLAKKHFEKVFNWLKNKNMLSEDGLEILEFGIDSEISLNNKMLNEVGQSFLNEFYDLIIQEYNYGSDEIIKAMDNYYIKSKEI